MRKPADPFITAMIAMERLIPEEQDRLYRVIRQHRIYPEPVVMPKATKAKRAYHRKPKQVPDLPAVSTEAQARINSKARVAAVLAAAPPDQDS